MGILRKQLSKVSCALVFSFLGSWSLPSANARSHLVPSQKPKDARVGTAVSVTGQVLIRKDHDKNKKKENEKDRDLKSTPSTASDDIAKVSGRTETPPSSPPPNAEEQAVQPLEVGDGIYEGDLINTSSNSTLKILFADKSLVDLGPSTVVKVERFKLKKVGDREVQLSMLYGKVRAAVHQKVGQQGRFLFRTRSATMGVRGTEFVVLSELDTSGKGKAPDANDLPDVSAAADTGGTVQATDSKEGTIKTQIFVVEGQVEVAPRGQEQLLNSPMQNPNTPNAPTSQKVVLSQGQALTATQPNNTGDSRAPASPVSMNVASIPPRQMEAVRNEAQVVDTTFVQAVQVDEGPDSNKPGRQSGMPRGGDTLGAIADNVRPNQGPPEFRPGDVRPPPGFNPDVGFGGFFPGVPSAINKARVVVRFLPQ